MGTRKALRLYLPQNHYFSLKKETVVQSDDLLMGKISLIVTGSPRDLLKNEGGLTVYHSCLCGKP
ncbi:hypothetical protein [Membranihabitans marinus]|uniref:hypothetical protein n=1 Tax=Membranihabitans marinus TaxID=1227546 RepID=UPI001F491F47|nr:hypothetical protein [Membranihabitans marinus]